MSKASRGAARSPATKMRVAARNGPENMKIIKNQWENITCSPWAPKVTVYISIK